MMNNTDIRSLCDYARKFSGLTEEKIQILHKNHKLIQPRLSVISDGFYNHLNEIPNTQPFLEGRLENLKKTHTEWLEELFTSDFGEDYTAKLYHVGDVHVKVALPLEFMCGAMTIIQAKMIRELAEIYPQGGSELTDINEAVNSAIGFSLQVMQESYQSSTLRQELDQFLALTGVSKVLFDNLVSAYR